MNLDARLLDVNGPWLCSQNNLHRNNTCKMNLKYLLAFYYKFLFRTLLILKRWLNLFFIFLFYSSLKISNALPWLRRSVTDNDDTAENDAETTDVNAEANSEGATVPEGDSSPQEKITYEYTAT